MSLAIEIIVDIIIAVASLVIGVIGKSIFDHYSDKNHRKYQIRLEQMVKRYNDKLKYYWPIYLHLSMSFTAWKHIKKGNKYLAKMDRINFEKITIIPLHEKICNILTEGIQTIEPDNDLMTEILKYFCHVRAYIFLRGHSTYDHLYPRDIGCPFPDNFAKLIILNLKEIQNDSCELLGKEEDITKTQIKNKNKKIFDCWLGRRIRDSESIVISEDQQNSISDIENQDDISESISTSHQCNIRHKNTFLDSLDYSSMEDYISFANIEQDSISNGSDTSNISTDSPITPLTPDNIQSDNDTYIGTYREQTSNIDQTDKYETNSDDNTTMSTSTENIVVKMVENKDSFNKNV